MYSHLAVLNPLYGGVGPYGGGVGFRRSGCRSLAVTLSVFSRNIQTTVIGNQLQLKVTVTNLGSALAEDIYVYVGFDAGNDQTWNSKESPLFNLDFNESIVATLYLSPPVGEHTRLIVQIVYGGFAVDESYSVWYDT